MVKRRSGRGRHMENSDAALDHQPVPFPPRRLASSARVFRTMPATEKKGVNRCGAGPMDASLFGRGVGEGLGVPT